MDADGSERLVSVIVAVYNGAATLGPTLASILAQTHRRLEVLVVDDGSTDDTPGIAARAASTDDRVVVVTHDHNRGRSGARNSGLDAATGSWVAIVDGDDLIAADRIEHLLDAADQFPGTNFVMDDRMGWWQDDAGAVHLTHRAPGRQTWRVGPPHRLDPVRHFADSFGQCDLMVDRAFLEVSAVRYPLGFEIGEDLAVANGLLFHPDCRPVRDARAGYYYRLGATRRTEGGPEAHIEMVAQVGRPELTELARRWQPAHSWLLARSDRQFAAEGRLEPTTFDRSGQVSPRVTRGLPMLVEIKALQWLSRLADRRTRPAIQADIEHQLSRTI